jgi:hypothetical protein
MRPEPSKRRRWLLDKKLTAKCPNLATVRRKASKQTD